MPFYADRLRAGKRHGVSRVETDGAATAVVTLQVGAAGNVQTPGLRG